MPLIYLRGGKRGGFPKKISVLNPLPSRSDFLKSSQVSQKERNMSRKMCHLSFPKIFKKILVHQTANHFVSVEMVILMNFLCVSCIFVKVGNPRCSMYGIFTYIWLKFMVNVGIYTIHGAYGNVMTPCMTLSSQPFCLKRMDESLVQLHETIFPMWATKKKAPGGLGYIAHTIHVGKYTIHGWYGYGMRDALEQTALYVFMLHKLLPGVEWARHAMGSPWRR